MKDTIHSRWRRIVYATILSAITLLFSVSPVLLPVCVKMETWMCDQAAALDQSTTRRDDFVFVGIDSHSTSLSEVDKVHFTTAEGNEAYQMMRDGWPWDRAIYAKAVDKLLNAGAKLVIIDLDLSQPSAKSEEGDILLGEAILKHKGKVVLGSVLEGVESEERSIRLLEPDAYLLGDDEYETPFGYVNFWTGQEQIVRDSRLFTTPSRENGTPPNEDESTFYSMSAVAAQQLGVEIKSAGGAIRFPPLGEKELASDVYPPVSFSSLFIEEYWQKLYDNGNSFKDKIIMIGPSSPIFQDEHKTPIGNMSGAQLHLHSLANILDNNRWLHPVNTSQAAILHLGSAVAGLTLALLFLSLSHRIRQLLFFYLLLILVLLISVYVFYINNILAVPLPAFISISAAFTGGIMCITKEEATRRRSLQRQLCRSMSPDVADAIVRAPDGYYASAKGMILPITILFSDIRGFTQRTESHSVNEIIDLLNHYFEIMTNVIFTYHGTIDKFIGDAIMATWGELDNMTVKQQVRDAISTAEHMLQELAHFNEERQAAGEDALEIGIGIHTGDALVGEIGSEKRTDFTAIGDSVNLASRIEALTSQLGLPLLVSKDVINILDHNEDFICVGNFAVKGRSSAISLFTKKHMLTQPKFITDLISGKHTEPSLILDLLAKNLDIQDNKLAHFYISYFKNLSDQSWDEIFHLTKK